MTGKLQAALEEVMDMEHPSIEQVLRKYGYIHEANKMWALMEAYRQANSEDKEQTE